ncbi:phosphate/phosphite/phosphonate ABC transporter substrate-binding protein [Streptosporangium sp. G11]|uniref:phosphate/phosphite/phosphonate ABC transporter substrate-binding protein n=1 Tax=Streptosporangium sp. G11 TaxID=3436926 RepID=UPI003EBC4F7A
MRNTHRTLAAAALVPLTALALTACGGHAEPGKAVAGTSTTCPNGKIRFGVEPFEDAAKLTPTYKVLGKALEAKLNCPVEVQIVQGYAAEVLAMQNGKLEIGQFGPLGYVFASRRSGAEAVATFGNPDKSVSSYKAGIWVPKDSPITDVAGLKGKKIALSEAGSTSGDALPRYAIRKAGMKDTDVKLNYAGGHPQALLALTYGKVDAAEINTQQLASATKEGKFDPAKYRQIWASDPIANDPITVAKGLDPATKKAIISALTSLTPQDVAQVGAYLDVEPGPLVAVTQATYQPLFDLADSLGLTDDKL